MCLLNLGCQAFLRVRGQMAELLLKGHTKYRLPRDAVLKVFETALSDSLDGGTDFVFQVLHIRAQRGWCELRIRIVRRQRHRCE